MEQKKPNLRCNSEYKRLYQPITEQAYLQLEAELKDFTDIVDIKTWVSIVLCDYEKLEICKKYNIAYRASRLYVRNSEEALLWLCKNQLERTDLTLEMRRYLIGKRYSYERILSAHDVASRRASSSVRGRPKKTEARYDDCAIKTQDRLSREYNVSISTIWKYYIFAEALDTIYDIDEDFASAIMRGNVKISQENVVSVSKLSEKEIRNMAEYLWQEQPDFKSFSGSRKILSKANNEKNDDAVPAKAPSIKDMPQYDPDSEVASLALTIPSWISSMKRVSNASDMSKVSDNAKARLRNELDRLSNAIFDMFDVLKEEK